MKSLDEILFSFDENTQNVLFLNGKGVKHPVWDDAGRRLGFLYEL